MCAHYHLVTGDVIFQKVISLLNMQFMYCGISSLFVYDSTVRWGLGIFLLNKL